MPDQGSSDAPFDLNFTETIELLNKNAIPYWVCHGTLLGLIRDSQLIPWDHDIDIALWAEDLPKSVLIELMGKCGFSVKDDGRDYDFVIFSRAGGREVDFNFYRVSADTEVAYSEWYLPRSRLTILLERLANQSQGGGSYQIVFRRMTILSPLARYLSRLANKFGLLYRSAGYTSPVDLLSDFQILEISGLRVRVPRYHEALLEHVYGSDWRVPKQQYDWTKESPATRVSNSRFR